MSYILHLDTMYTFSNIIKHIFVTSTATPSSLWPSLHLVWGAVLIISYNIGGTVERLEALQFVGHVVYVPYDECALWMCVYSIIDPQLLGSQTQIICHSYLSGGVSLTR
jgi:hypothetical protein